MNEPGEKCVLLVQADYYAECGIRGQGGYLCYPVDRLGISAELDAKMREWIASYDAIRDEAKNRDLPPEKCIWDLIQ